MSTKAAHRADCRTSRPTKLAKLDVIEDEGKIVLRAEMPGIKPDDVKIEVADDVLTVHGEHEEAKESNKGETKDAGKRFLRRERSYASFTRSGTLPPKVDPSKIEASVHDGVVEITVPLPEEGADKVVQITPKTGSRRFANAAVGGARARAAPAVPKSRAAAERARASGTSPPGAPATMQFRGTSTRVLGELRGVPGRGGRR